MIKHTKALAAAILNDLGNCHAQDQNFPEASKSFEQSLEVIAADDRSGLRARVLVNAAGTARRSGDAATAVALATEGLALFRGEVLVDVGDSDWLQAQRAQLEEVRMGLLEDLFAARVDLGAGGEVVGELEALIERYPLREGVWSSLVTALYRAGRQAEALAAYSKCERCWSTSSVSSRVRPCRCSRPRSSGRVPRCTRTQPVARQRRTLRARPTTCRRSPRRSWDVQPTSPPSRC